MRSTTGVSFFVALVASLLGACSTFQPPPAAGDLLVSDRDGARLHYIPAGAFSMGNDEGWAGRKPAHDVALDAFWIDETEVTNRMYALCVAAGPCRPPEGISSYTHDQYYVDPQYGDFPVVYVSWEDASVYCSWAGRVLPTEEQWEKAARGPDGRLYPWGNDPPAQNLLNNFDVTFLEDTVEVGSYPEGASPYGALDMAGNVWEWTADWFQPYPGGDPHASENFGQTYRVLRGGSFVDPADATVRYHNFPDLRNYDIGFRCALRAAQAAR